MLGNDLIHGGSRFESWPVVTWVLVKVVPKNLVCIHKATTNCTQCVWVPINMDQGILEIWLSQYNKDQEKNNNKTCFENKYLILHYTRKTAIPSGSSIKTCHNILHHGKWTYVTMPCELYESPKMHFKTLNHSMEVSNTEKVYNFQDYRTSLLLANRAS